MSAIDEPAEPTQEENSTTNQAKGGLFTDTSGVGIDLSSLTGDAGRGIVSIVQTPANPGDGVDSTITITYTDATSDTFDIPSGTDGIDGQSIDEITATLDNDTRRTQLDFLINSVIVGTAFVPWGVDGTDGRDGTDGDAGLDGTDGVGITSVTTDDPTPSPGDNVTITVNLSNGDTPQFVIPAGAMGNPGTDGMDGADGATGPQGVSITDVDVIGPVTTDPAVGNTYRIAVTLTDNDGTSTVVNTDDTFLAPVGPRGMGSGGNISLDNGVNIVITETSPDTFEISAPDARDALDIRGASVPAIPTTGGPYLLEYDNTSSQFIWVTVPSGTTIDSALNATSTNPVENRALFDEFATKQDTLTFDSTPTAGNTDHVVSSDGIRDALDLKLNISDTVRVVEHGDNSPVASDNIADAFDAAVVDVDLLPATGEISQIRVGGVYNLDENGNITVTGGTVRDLAGEDNVQADYTETDTTSDSFIQNKPVLTTINDAESMPGDWIVRTGDVTSVDNNARIIVLGANAGPAPHPRLSTSFNVLPPTSVEGSTPRITLRASASVLNGSGTDAVTNVEYVTINSSVGTVGPGAAGTAQSDATFDLPSGNTGAQTITFTGSYRVTATLDGDESTTTHNFSGTHVIAPNWYSRVLDQQPLTIPGAQNNDAFVVGDTVTVAGIPNGVIYVWIPTTATDPFFTTDNPNIYYQLSDPLATDGDHTLYSLGAAVDGNYIIRVGGV